MSCEFVTKIGTGDCELANKCNNKSENDFSNKLANEIVSEMIDNAVDIAGSNDNNGNFTKIVDGILDNLSDKFHEMVLTDDRIESVESCSITCKGLGDQLKTKEKLQKGQTSQRHPPVEKKNRLTDLVKNSRHILEKLMINDREKAAMAAKPEKLVRVVELNSGDDGHVMPSTTEEERQHAPTPFDDEQPSFDEQDEEMEDVDIIEKDGSEDFNAAKSKTLPPMASTCSSEKTLSLSAKWRTLKMSSCEFKKKKWNIGTKLVSYIRKAQQGKSSTTLKKDTNEFEDAGH